MLKPGDADGSQKISDWPGQFREARDPALGIYRITKTATREGPSSLGLAADAHFEIVP